MSDHKELSYRHPAGRFAGCKNRAGKGDLSGPLRRLIRIAVTPSLLALTILGMGLATAYASLPGTPYLSEDQLTSVAPAPSGGFWIQRQSENVCPPDCSTTPAGFTLQVDGAPIYDNIHHAGLIALVPKTEGYWVVTGDGEIHARGGAPNLCNGDLGSCSGFVGGARHSLTGVAATPTGHGFWAVARDGAVWTAGDANSFGDSDGDKSVPTGIVGTPSGNGYYIVVENGGVHTFGDAVFYGSTGGNKPGGHHITGLALSTDTTGAVNGYWLVLDDGGVLSCGAAPFWGSSGGTDSEVTSITSFPTSEQNNTDPETIGYAWVNAKGHLGMCTRDRPCGGALSSTPPATPECH